MFGSEVLEVVIGLVFIYLLLSLLTTAVNELIARALALRAKTLADAIKKIVGENKIEDFYNHPLIKMISPTGRSRSLQNEGKGRPSYIDPETFATAALDVLVPRKVTKNGNLKNDKKYIKEIRKTINNLPDNIKKPILLALSDADDELAAIRKQLEHSFNQLMERVSGWYKRKTQLISLLVGLLITLASNADSIAIANALLRDATLRDAIVASAEQLATEEEAELSQNINDLQDQLLETQILGWITTPEDTSPDEANGTYDPRAKPAAGDWAGWALKIFGWSITAFALSLGAPFWFDILKRIASVRATGTPPQAETVPQEFVTVQVKTKPDTNGS